MKMPALAPDNRLFAPCGMNCLVCYKHAQNKNPCPGCHCGDTGKPAHCRSCKIKDCAAEKGLIHCYVCEDFPCLSIRRLEKTYTVKYGVSLLANSRLVEEKGLAAFFALQKIVYSCSYCGGVVSLHDGVCTECGKPAKNKNSCGR